MSEVSMSRKPGKLTAVRCAVSAVYLVLFCVLMYSSIHFNEFYLMQAVILSSIALFTFTLLWLPGSFSRPFRIVCCMLLPAAAFLLTESMTHVVWDTMEWDAVLLNLVFYYLLSLFLFFLTGRTSVALCILLLFTVIIGLANYFVILFRSSPILPWDLLSIGTAASVADGYTYSITWLVAQLCGGLLFCLVLACRCDLRFVRLSPGWLTGLLRAALCALLLIPSALYVRYLYQPDIAEKTSLDNTLFTPGYMFRRNGFFVAFIMDSRYLQVDMPEGYDKAYAEALLDSYPAQTELPEELPNVVVIMDECFSDPAVNGSFDVNQDYMPFVRRLMEGAEDVISGELLVSVLGGNTANTEFEYLTGNSMAFLPAGSVAYQQYLIHYASSYVSSLRDLGYRTVAMHPYNASGWNRVKVYDMMGFDSFLSLKNFKNNQKLRKYVSDASDFAEVLSVLQEMPDQPSFIFNVTMQNHSPFGTDYEDFHPDVEAVFSNTKSTKILNNYLSLMKETDTALQAFLEELATLDRPTVVVFFGDHQPNDIVVKPIFKEHGLDIDNQTLEQAQKRRIVPFFVWANYDIPEASDQLYSSSCLSAVTMEAAGLPLTSYQRFLKEMSSVIPGINPLGFMRPDGSFHTLAEASDEEARWIQDYQILQYYYLFDQ